MTYDLALTFWACVIIGNGLAPRKPARTVTAGCMWALAAAGALLLAGVFASLWSTDAALVLFVAGGAIAAFLYGFGVSLFLDFLCGDRRDDRRDFRRLLGAVRRRLRILGDHARLVCCLYRLRNPVTEVRLQELQTSLKLAGRHRLSDRNRGS